MNAKVEAQKAIGHAIQMIEGSDGWGGLERKLCVATLQHALENLDKLTVARPRKGTEEEAL